MPHELPISTRQETQITIPVTMVLVAVLVAAVPLRAATLTVCDSGCDQTTIQDAVDAAADGDTIYLVTASHTENEILIDTSVTIEGLGVNTVVQAAPTSGTVQGRIATVDAASTVVLRHLVLRFGSVAGTDTLDGGGAIANHGSLVLEDVLLEHNEAESSGGAILNNGTLVLRASDLEDNTAVDKGGAVYNRSGAILVADGANFAGNVAGISGGGLANFGMATLNGCVVRDGQAAFGGGLYNLGGTLGFSGLLEGNSATQSGGAISNSFGSLEVTLATIDDNTAQASAGGAYVTSGAARFTDTTFSRNSAQIDGGALYHSSSTPTELVNVTMSHNSANGNGGAVYVEAGLSVVIASSTLADNSADLDQDGDGDGGGIYLEPCTGICPVDGSGDGQATVRNAILADNVDRSASGPFFHDCDGQITSEGYSLIEEGATDMLAPCRVIGDLTGVVLGADPALGGLTDNGGTPAYPGGEPPSTRFLMTGSLAIDAGDPVGCTAPDGSPLTTDQRGANRVATCDMGSFEWGGVPAEVVFADGFESATTFLWSGP